MRLLPPRSVAAGILLLASCGSSVPHERDIIHVSLEEPNFASQRALDRSSRSETGYVLPQDGLLVLSDFWDCRSRHRRHRGLDLVSSAPDAGLGTPLGSIGRAEVLEIDTPEGDPERYGERLREDAVVARGGQDLPTMAPIVGYGDVYFFTDDHGSAHTGVMVVTRLLDGPLAGYTVRYMHLAVPRPDLAPGVILEAGEELGLMGGTSILESTPHVHIDAEDPTGTREDLAPWLGLPTRSEDDVPDC